MSFDRFPAPVVRFALRAEADPSLLPRLLAPFARRAAVPDEVNIRRAGGTMRVEIAIGSLSEADARLIEGNLRQVVGVIELRRDDVAASRAA